MEIYYHSQKVIMLTERVSGGVSQARSSAGKVRQNAFAYLLSTAYTTTVTWTIPTITYSTSTALARIVKEGLDIMKTKLIKHQVKEFRKNIPLEEYGYYGPGFIVAKVRHDDQCGNGHNTFSITAHISYPGARDWIAGGCIHDEVVKHFPELRPYLKWHLCSTDGPLHYIANTVYHASNRDHHGLLKDEKRQLRNGKTGQLCWELEESKKLPNYVHSDTRPTDTATIKYVPWCRIGEGKERDFDAARSCAIWPDATDETLSLPKEELTKLLEARLPALLKEFAQAVTELGFEY